MAGWGWGEVYPAAVNWLLVTVFIGYAVWHFAAWRWLAARWMANGMTAGRAAALSMAIQYLPLALMVGLILRQANLGTATLLAAVLVLVVLPSYAMRRATFRYMSDHGVREQLKRLQDKRSGGKTEG
jgi:hypothetical protein